MIKISFKIEFTDLSYILMQLSKLGITKIKITQFKKEIGFCKSNIKTYNEPNE